MSIFDNIILDEHLIIALAFFVCIGLIITLFGAKIKKGLEDKKNSICVLIDESENELKNSQLTKDLMLKKENEIKKEIELLMNNAEKEKEYILESTQLKSQKSLDQKVSNQQTINERMKKEKLVKFNIIAWDSAAKFLRNNLLIENELNETEMQKKHSALIDKFLLEVMKNN